jgi:hypothetical protein
LFQWNERTIRKRSLDAISSTLNTYSKVDTKKTDDTKQKEAVASSLTKDTSSADKTTSDNDTKNNGVVFDKSESTKNDSTNQIYNKDAIISKLKADQQSRLESMQSLVEKLLNKQKGTFDLASLMKKDDVSGLNLSATFEEAVSVRPTPAALMEQMMSCTFGLFWKASTEACLFIALSRPVTVTAFGNTLCSSSTIS